MTLLKLYTMNFIYIKAPKFLLYHNDTHMRKTHSLSKVPSKINLSKSDSKILS